MKPIIHSNPGFFTSSALLPGDSKFLPLQRQQKKNKHMSNNITEQAKKINQNNKAIASNNTGLNDGILLSGKRLNRKSELREKGGPALDKEEAEQTSGNIEGGDDPNREIELMSDYTEESAKHRAHHQTPNSNLLLPIWNRIHLRLHLVIF
nr:uncharacterized protein LOC21412289 [Ipomoea batatas]